VVLALLGVNFKKDGMKGFVNFKKCSAQRRLEILRSGGSFYITLAFVV
jgi:hypothetical protein